MCLGWRHFAVVIEVVRNSYGRNYFNFHEQITYLGKPFYMSNDMAAYARKTYLTYVCDSDRYIRPSKSSWKALKLYFNSSKDFTIFLIWK
jgi:hypothetical protein